MTAAATSDTPGAGPTPRYVIVAGGAPGADELAAMVVALTPVAMVGPVAPRGAPPLDDRWTAAALAEGVGGRPAVSAPDVARLG